MSVEKFISLEKAQLAALTSQLDDLGDLLKQSKGDLALLLASTAPPPIGTAADVVSLGVSIGRGDWGGAFWDVIGLVPVVGDGVKGAVKGTKLAKKIADITAKIAKARKKIDNRTKNIRKNAQKKCDKLLGNTKKRKSDKDAATNGCTTNCGGKNVDPPGTKRNTNGQLYDEKTGRFVDDPNAPKEKYSRSKAERKKALERDANDPNSDLTPEARDYIKKHKGKKVPDKKYNEDYEGDVDYAVHHEKPLHTEKTIEGKKGKDVVGNMETIPKNDHIDTHRKCGDSFHDYPRKN